MGRTGEVRMRVLVACEFSGVVREAFRRRGHDAWSCDLLPALDKSPYHIQGDAIETAWYNEWDLAIFHPECTYLTNSGVKHLYVGGRKENGRNDERWNQLADAALFFVRCIETKEHIPRVAIENPRMHCYARNMIPFSSTQVIQPWMFGHGETKETHLWLFNLPPLVPTNVVDGRAPRVHFESPGIKNGLTRKQRRSIFFPGIADAMADQWGSL